MQIIQELRTCKFGRQGGKYKKFTDEHLLYLSDPVNLEIWKDLTSEDIISTFKSNFRLGPEFSLHKSYLGKILRDFKYPKLSLKVNNEKKLKI